MKFLHSSKFILFGILFLAVFFRLSNVNWDQGFHLHPDERFLTMVGIAMKPMELSVDYFNPAISTFNPTNIGYQFYVYGTLPVVLTKYIAILLEADNYMDFTILGRILSALVDIAVVYLIYKFVQLLEKKHNLHTDIKYWAAFFYTISVLPIQLSHFFAVDTFVNFFAFSAFFFMVKYSYTNKYKFLLFSAILFGCAIGSKISAVYYSPLLFSFLIKGNLVIQHKRAKIGYFSKLLVPFIIFGLFSYISTRFSDPYLFQNPNFLDPRPNQLFLDNLKTLQTWGNPSAWFPPSVQWIHKPPVIFALSNLFIFGIGLAYTVLTLYGIIITIFKRTHWDFKLILLWMAFFFLYQSIQFSKTMRYFLFLYPFLAIFASLGFFELTRSWNKIGRIILIIILLIWPLMFYSIYTKDHTRTTASQWIYDNIPNGSILLSEHWDDALPLSTNPSSQKKFVIDELHVYDPDTQEKWDKINEQLQQGNYLILSSNRAWGSIPTVPERYPLTKKFYEELLSGQSNYKKIAEFTSYPSLSYLGIPVSLPDDWSEEAFTVYDHPKVIIFQKQ